MFFESFSKQGPVIGAVSLIATGLVTGAGFYLPNQSVKATSRGNAWIATADSPAAVYYNPAGLTQLETASLETGVYTIQLGNKVKIDGEEYSAENKWQPVPHFYYAKPLSEKWSFGFGMYSPFGLGNEWGHDTPFRNITTKTEVVNIRASGVLGYKVNDEFSLGWGFSVNYAEALLEQGLTPYDPANPSRDYLEFEGDDIRFSWIIGALWKPSPRHSFAAVYRSHSNYTLKGDLKGSEGFGIPYGRAKIDLTTPASAAIGYAYKPSSKWTIEVNVEWVDWRQLDTLTIETGSGDLPSQGFDWDSRFIYVIGVSYALNDNWEINFGYDYNEGVQPDQFYGPAVTDKNYHWLNAGAVYKTGNYEWALAYQYGFASHKVDNSEIGTNGDYDSSHHSIMVSGRYNF